MSDVPPENGDEENGTRLGVEPIEIQEEMERSFLDYAMSVITARALPDARDGLKPVHRRILWGMHDIGARPDRSHLKCARVTGHVLGHFHPHGEGAIYDSLVRMAQDFSLRHPLVDGHGNFGSPDFGPAAARYTECRLAQISMAMLDGIDEETVDFVDNYSNETEEPVVLPSRFPNLLVNGSQGIAVGMATNIPPHNLGSVIEAAVQLIDEPGSSTAQLLDRLKGPDFPLGGKVVTDRTTLRKIYEEGTGSIKVQGEWKLETTSRREQIVITSIPYGVNKGNLEAQIGEIIETRKLPQLLGQTNESNEKDGLRIVLELKADTDPNLVMAYLYRHTTLQENFAYNMTCLVPGPDGSLRPERLGLKEVLRYFLDFRFATVRRRFEYELEQVRQRIHILEGFRTIFNALDRALKIIRESDGKADAAEKLIKAFKLDEEQAAAVLDAQLYRIAQLEIKKILNELKEKKAEAERIEGILASKKKLWGVVKAELAEVGEKFADRRRTRVALGEEALEFDEEAYIVKENTNVVLTRDGWIKRVGRLASVEGTRVREGDEVIAVVPGSTLDHVVLLADDGTAYTMRINEVPASSGYGEPAAKFFRLDDQARIVNAVTTDERFTPPDKARRKNDPPEPYLLVVTVQGQTLRTPLAPFRTESTKVGRRYAKMNDGDKVVLATVLRGDEETVYLASADGHVIHFKVDDINVLAGAGKGVMGIKLDDEDTCLGGALMSGRLDKMVLETSGGKTMEFGRGKYEVTSRGGKGFEAVKRSTFVRVVPPPIELVNWDEIEGKNGGNGKGHEKNGKQKMLFE